MWQAAAGSTILGHVSMFQLDGSGAGGQFLPGAGQARDIWFAGQRYDPVVEVVLSLDFAALVAAGEDRFYERAEEGQGDGAVGLIAHSRLGQARR